jgi:hypothetical protein
MKWAYGVTTVRARFDDLLPRSLHSLALAGFGEPRLFVDGDQHPDIYRQRFDLEATVRYPQMHVYPNFILSLWELYLREPFADRYALFQDDLISVKNLRGYLTQLPYPPKSYLNLYTFMNNEDLIKGKPVGFVPASQNGRGAMGLVFDNEAMLTLLGSAHMAKRVQCTRRCKGNLPRGWTHSDGATVEAMNAAGWSEYVHNPSLLRHTGNGKSATGSANYRPDRTFPGEDFDALEWLT